MDTRTICHWINPCYYDDNGVTVEATTGVKSAGSIAEMALILDGLKAKYPDIKVYVYTDCVPVRIGHI